MYIIFCKYSIMKFSFFGFLEALLEVHIYVIRAHLRNKGSVY